MPSMEELLSDISKYLSTLCKHLAKHIGKGKSTDILAGIPAPSGDAEPYERAEWAAQVSECLERFLDKEYIVRVNN